jgi:predicted  nucleic acid-binding Zn-ribbon protein
MAGSKFDYLKMLYDDFGKKKEAFQNHNATIESHLDGLSESVYEAAKLYREKYENLRVYKQTKPKSMPNTPFELGEPKEVKNPQDSELSDVSDKIENIDDKIKGAISEIQYRYKQLNKVIASLSAVSANYKEIINDIFDTWDDVMTKEENE